MFELVTPLSYWILTILWSVILGLYLVKLRHLSKAGGAIAVLLTILALDAFRTLFESLYFGFYFNSLFGFLPAHIGTVLGRPELLVIPKVINIVVGVVVLVLLVRRWIPREVREKEARMSEQAASRERMELALQGADLGTWDWNVQTGELIFNERWAGMLGYAVEEIEPHVRGWERLSHPDDRLNSEKILADHIKGRTLSYEAEHRLRHKLGDWIWVLDRGRVTERDADGKALRACGTYLDITRRKQVEAALQKSEHLLQESQRVARIGSYVLDISSGIWEGSLALNYIFGADEAYEHSLTGWLALLHPEDQQWVADYLAHDVIEAHGRFDKEYRILRQNDGAERWVHGLGKLEFDDQGQPLSLLGTIQDITERKLAEEAQRKTTVLLESVHEANPDLQFVLDSGGVITHFHANEQELYVPPEEFFGKRMQDVLPEEIGKKFERSIQEAKARESLVTLEYTLPMPKGKRFYESRIVSLADKRLVVMIRDITERKQTEEALRKLVEATSFQIGAALFDSISMELLGILGADCVFIGEAHGVPPKSIKTISVTADGKRTDDFEYDLAGTPCENVVGKSLCSYASGVVELFPRDRQLKELRVEAYVGVPLFDSHGSTLGNLAALFQDPIEDVEFKES
ncbi:MAG: PAS domain-containing protein, partial [Candidatus Hydrogenedentes bacterium]|nr:PAS domain-containing protein [Candidatus Hydrogenedentota bacterium]